MTFEEAMALLKEHNAEAALAVGKEVETLKNKGVGVEAERTRADNLKTELDQKVAEHTTEVEKLKAEVETAKTQAKTDTDGFKSLYEEEKAKVVKLETTVRTSTEEAEGLKLQKKKLEENIANDIEALYADIEDEEEKASLKTLAEKYPIDERASFIVGFKEKYISKNKKKGGGPSGGSNNNGITLEDIQAEYDELAKVATKTPAQMAAFRKAAKYLSGELKL